MGIFVKEILNTLLNMSTIDSLINYCFDSYHSPKKCDNCKNDNFCGESNNCYDKCIYQIHRNYNRTKTYNCSNMVLYYILKHFYCFVSEIEAFWECLKLETMHSPIKIASIGCGPASELYAISNYKENKGVEFDYTFIGFDLNEIWNEIWDFNRTIIPQAEFYLKDAFDYYNENPEETPNVLILNYMLSDMAKFDHDNIKLFLSKLINLIDAMPINSWVLLNDISYIGSPDYNRLDTAYNCFEYLANNIKSTKDINYYFYRVSFNPLAYTGKHYGGKKYPNKNLRMPINTKMYAKNIYPRLECNSVQMIIKKISAV